jgi:AcrR family transcriptional regulator
LAEVDATVARHAGRPRDLRLDEALYRSALEVMLERGYHPTTFSEIARRAGVGTPAIYRRWPTKAAIAMDLYEREAGAAAPIPESGSVRDLLIEVMRIRLRASRTRFFHQVALPLLLETQANRAVGDAFAARFREYPKAVVTRLRHAVETGQLREAVDPNRMLDLLMGTIVVPLLYGQEPPADSEAEAIVDQVLTGFAPGPSLPA